MKQMLSAKPTSITESSVGEEDFERYLKIFRENLIERGEEVLEAAMRDYPDVTRKIVTVLAKKILEGKIIDKISGGDLLRLFENLGIPVRIETSIKYYRHGEYKSLSDLLKE
ncbi:MAG: hypothetical protein QXU28_01460 [Nitrososphaerota archaeon]